MVKKMKEPGKNLFHFEDEKHFSLFDAIKGRLREGDVTGLDEILTSSDYLHDTEHIFFDDVSLAIAAFEYMWAQSSYVAIEAGVDAAEAGRLYEYYRHELLGLQDVSETLRANQAFHHALCILVYQCREDSGYSKLIKDCRQYVREHILEPPSVQGTADALGVSRGHLSFLFKKETGQTLQDFIKALRLAEIVEFIEDPAVPSSDIWAMTGFCSQSHYIQFFKTMTGQTPLQFEKESQNTSAASVRRNQTPSPPNFARTPETESVLEQLDEYAEGGGYTQQLYQLYCVRKGRYEELEKELNDPKQQRQVQKIFQGNRTMALKTLLYLLPQISSAAVDGGVSLKSASRIYIDIIQKTSSADCDRILELIRDAYLTYTKLVVDSQAAT